MFKLPHYIYYLLIGQSINLITAVLSVTVAAIVGLSIAPDPSYATIPYGLQFFAILISTLYFSNLMKKFGRYRIFMVGIVFLFLSGIFGYFSLLKQNFYLLCLSHFLLGLFISTANFYRFAATDGLDGELVPKATSIVISGGVFAAIIAPILAIKFENFSNFPHYSAIYLILSVLSIFLFFVITQWNTKFKNSIEVSGIKKMSIMPSYTPMNVVVIAILGGALGYYLMNLMMITSSLYLKMNHSFHYASIAIQMHVLAMFLPSFFVAKIIKRIGGIHTIIIGFVFISISSLIPILFEESMYINIALVFLGIGWNFCYSGGSTLIGGLQGENRIKIQGINEMIIALFATLGAFFPALMLKYLGWFNINIFSVIFSICLMICILFFKKISWGSYEKN